MKNIYSIIGIIIVGGIAIGGYFWGQGLNENTPSGEEQNTKTVTEIKPDRVADLYGKVKKTEGNMITLTLIDRSQDPTIGMEQAEKRAYMAALSEDDRMALKDKITNAELEDVEVLIPIGIPISVKKEQGPDAQESFGSLADVQVRKILSVWISSESKDRNIAEYAKISFSR